MSSGFLFAVLTGLLFGLQGVYGKYVSQRLPAVFLTWITFSFATPFVLVLLIVDGVPHIHWPAFIWPTLTSFAINLVAYNLFFQALSVSPLYLTMPFTAFTPLFMVPIAYFLLGEMPGLPGIAGILMIIGGAYFILSRSPRLLEPLENLFREKGTRYMLAVSLLWSVSATVEKIAVLNSSPLFYAVTINALLAAAYFPYIYFRHRNLLKTLSSDSAKLAVLGIISGLLVFSQFNALLLLKASYVIAFKRAGVIISILLGSFFFEEKNLAKHFLCTAMIVWGAVLIML